MTREILLSLLRQGSTGAEILNILDTVASGIDAGDDTAEPTLDAIDF